MWLLNCETSQLEPFEGETRPPYAILSHRWEGKEVSFQDVMAGRHNEMEGWQKIRSCCQQAKREGLEYVWADTCCIDKRSSAELSEAINSMYKWYKQSKICYAYLADVTHPGTSRRISDSSEQEPTLSHEASEENSPNPSGQALIKSVWFTRGWTLQELLAPERLEFYDRHWRSLGTRNDPGHRQFIKERTDIPDTALENFEPKNHCIAEKMTWAAGRETSRVEDRTYSLLGLFEINMPLLYGEGDKAFERLQNELIRTSVDTTIYAWLLPPPPSSQMGPLASSPDCYQWNSPYDSSLRIPWNYAKETSISKEGISGRFRVRPFCLDVFGASLGWFNDGKRPYHRIVMFLKKIDHSLYRRVLLDGQGYAVISTNTMWEPVGDSPLITIRLEPVLAYSSKATYASNKEYSLGHPVEDRLDKGYFDSLHEAALQEAVPGLLLSERLSKRIENHDLVGKNFGKLSAWIQGRSVQNRPLSVSIRPDSSPCILLTLTRNLNTNFYPPVLVTFSPDITWAPTANAHFTRGYRASWNHLLPNRWYMKRMPEQYKDRLLIMIQRSNWKARTARHAAKDHEALTSAFHEIDKEEANGVRIQQLGRDIKVAYIPTRHRRILIFLAFRDTTRCEKLPREWLYPPLEGLLEMAQKPSRWQLIRFVARHGVF